MGDPARGYSWPPAAKGNALALKHGVFATDRARQVAAEVNALAEQVAVDYPWTTAYADERRAYARALVDERDVREWLDRVGVLDEKHRERPAVRTMERFAARAARCRSVLGLNPASHARLLVAVATVVCGQGEHPAVLDEALTGLLEAGRAALERGADRQGGTPAIGSGEAS